MFCPACGQPLSVENRYDGNQYCMKCGEEIPLTNASPSSTPSLEGVPGPTQEDQERTRVFLQVFLGLLVAFLGYLVVRYGNLLQAWVKTALK